MRTADLCALTGTSRATIWRDARAGLLPRPPRRQGVRDVVYPAHAVKRYLSLKFPHLLPPA